MFYLELFSSFRLFSAKSFDMYRQLTETKFWYIIMDSCWYRHNLQINAGTYSAVKNISVVLALKRLPWWVLFTLR